MNEKVKCNKCEYYVPYVPSFFDLDEKASNEDILNRFKEWVGFSYREFREVNKVKNGDDRTFVPMIYGGYIKTYLLEAASNEADMIIKSGICSEDNLYFICIFWVSSMSDPKFKEALNKKKKEVLDSMNKKENNENFNIENQINNN